MENVMIYRVNSGKIFSSIGCDGSFMKLNRDVGLGIRRRIVVEKKGKRDRNIASSSREFN
jgi:hypothetical protein